MVADKQTNNNVLLRIFCTAWISHKYNNLLGTTCKLELFYTDNM